MDVAACFVLCYDRKANAKAGEDKGAGAFIPRYLYYLC
ncbi:MAG: hypothetical protein KatS3mg033_2477 [Thermonema sp.]|nr:MAG: hypothetical protein KatS3mg033_2477 [Thermonema sp.]